MLRSLTNAVTVTILALLIYNRRLSQHSLLFQSDK